MKKIRNIRQLESRQRKLRRRRAELEDAIQSDWLELKDSLRPSEAFMQLFRRIFEKEKEAGLDGNDFIAESLGELAAHFTRKFAISAEEKIKDWWDKQ